MTKNRFAALLEERGMAPVESPSPLPPAAPVPTAPVAAPPPPAAIPVPPIRVGKRSDPAYRQISTYVRSDVYKTVRKELTDLEMDFSDLLDELLAKWIATRKGV